MTPRTADVIAVAPTILICKSRHVCCPCALAAAQEEPVCQMYVWDAYLASTLLRCLFHKRLIASLSQHWEAFLASACLESLLGKCIVGTPIPDAVAAPRAQKDTKNTQKSSPEDRFWKPKCSKIASWSFIFFPSRFWSQNGTCAQVHPNIFLRFWELQGSAKTAKNQQKVSVKI